MNKISSWSRKSYERWSRMLEVSCFYDELFPQKKLCAPVINCFHSESCCCDEFVSQMMLLLWQAGSTVENAPVMSFPVTILFQIEDILVMSCFLSQSCSCDELFPQSKLLLWCTCIVLKKKPCAPVAYYFRRWSSVLLQWNTPADEAACFCYQLFSHLRLYVPIMSYL